MSIRYSRAELRGILAARAGDFEGQGPQPYIDFTLRVTPELLDQMLGGVWVARDGSRQILDAVYIGDDGLLYPEMRDWVAV